MALLFIGRALRQALDRKVKKLKSMQSANEDISIVLERVVCRLMKLALRTFKSEQSPPPTRWMLRKLLDLLTLTERAIARRNKYYIENFDFDKLVSAEENDRNRKTAIQEFEEKNPSKIKLDDYEMEIGKSEMEIGKSESICSTPNTCQNELDMVDTFFSNTDIFEELKLEDLNHSPKLISPENTIGSPDDNSERLNGLRYEMVAYHCSRQRATLRTNTFCTSAVRYKCKKIRARISKDRLICEKEKYKPDERNSRRIEGGRKLSSHIVNSRTRVSPITTSQKGMRKTKAVFDEYRKIKLKSKTSHKVHKKLQSTVSKPIPGSIIELCHPELTYQKNEESLRNSPHSSTPISATQRCHEIEIVTESGHETIAMKRSTGTNPERIDEDEEYETIVNVTKNDSPYGLQFDIDDAQTIFLNDINEPSTSKGVRHVKMDVQCSPIATAHVLSPATSFTARLPDMFSVGLKIEDSLNNLTTRKNLNFGYSVQCDKKCMEIVNERLTSPDKSKSRGIKIEDSTSNFVMEEKDSRLFESFNKHFGSISPIIRSPSTPEIDEPRINVRKRSSSHTNIFLNRDQKQIDIFNIAVGENIIDDFTTKKTENMFSKTLSIKDSVQNVTIIECGAPEKNNSYRPQNNSELQRDKADNLNIEMERRIAHYKKCLIEELKRKNICHSKSSPDVCKDIKLTSDENSSSKTVSELNEPGINLEIIGLTSEQKTIEPDSEVISSYEQSSSTLSKDLKDKSPRLPESEVISSFNNMQNNESQHVDKTSATSSYLSLSCGGIQIHSHKGKNSTEDIVYKGMWEHQTSRININSNTVCLPSTTSIEKQNTKKNNNKRNDGNQTKGKKESKNIAKKFKPNDTQKSSLPKRENVRNTKLISEKKDINSVNEKKEDTRTDMNANKNIVKVASKVRTNTGLQRSKIPRYIKIRTRPSKQVIAEKERNNHNNGNSLKNYLPSYLIRRKCNAAQKAKQNLLQSSKVELNKLEEKTNKFVNHNEAAAQNNIKTNFMNNSLSQVPNSETTFLTNKNVISAKSKNSDSGEITETKKKNSKLSKNKPNTTRKKLDRKSMRKYEKNKENILSSSNNLVENIDNIDFNITLTGIKQNIFMAHLPEKSIIDNNISKNIPNTSSISNVISTTNDKDEIKNASSNACTSSNITGNYSKDSGCNTTLNEVLNDILDTSNNKITSDNANPLKHIEEEKMLVVDSSTDDSQKYDETSSLLSFKTVITNNSLSSADLEDTLNHSLEESADDSLPSIYVDLNVTQDIQSHNLTVEHVENISQPQPPQRTHSNSVRHIYEGNSLRHNQNPQTTLASEVLSGFSVNESLVGGDHQPHLMRLVDSETGSYTVVERVRQAASEEIYISGLADSGTFTQLDEDVVFPDWLFSILSHQESLIVENGTALVNPLPEVQEPFVMYGPEHLRDMNGNVLEPGVRAGAGAGDGHGMHSDNSEDSSGHGSSLSSSDASSRQQSENIPEANTTVATRNVTRSVTANHSYTTRTEARVTQVGNTPTEGCHHYRVPLPPSDVEADVSSLDTDVPSDDN